MKISKRNISPPQNLDPFKRRIQAIIEDFQHKANEIVYPPFQIHLKIYEDETKYLENSERLNAGPIFTEKRRDSFYLHLSKDVLEKLNPIAFQGLLLRKAALCIPYMQPELHNCNFRKKIFPLLPVTGLAENHMREVTRHLERTLHIYRAIASLIDMGYGISQVHLHFYRLTVGVEDADRYREILPHSWMRALFLCRTLEDFSAIDLLVRKGVTGAFDLRSFWIDTYSFILTEDQRLMEELSEFPEKHDGNGYADQVIGMFKRIKEALLDQRNEIGSWAEAPLH